MTRNRNIANPCRSPASTESGAPAVFRGQCLGWLRLVLLGASFWGGFGLTQTNEEVFRDYQFNFIPPGARANAMGGAFIGLADDATSSFANPAGLAFLRETAVTFEFRSRELDTRIGNIEGNFNTTEFEQLGFDLEGIGFISLNFRLADWYFGVFRHDYLNERQERSFKSRIFSGGQQRAEERDIFLDLRGRAYGVGVARRIGSHWKAGFSLNYARFEGETSYNRNGFVVSIPPQRIVYQSSIEDDDLAWGYSLGALHQPSERFSWGVVWRENPRFNLRETVFEEVSGEAPLFDEVDVPFVTPDVVGVGGRYEIRGRSRPYKLNVLLDWQKIFYSQIIEDGFLIILGSEEGETKDNYVSEDKNQFNVGFEWQFPGGGSQTWAVRCGYYRNPFHAVSYRGDDLAIRSRFEGVGLSDEDHVTFGVGWALGNRVQLDFAANLWEFGQEFTASFIWRKK